MLFITSASRKTFESTNHLASRSGTTRTHTNHGLRPLRHGLDDISVHLAFIFLAAIALWGYSPWATLEQEMIKTTVAASVFAAYAFAMFAIASLPQNLPAVPVDEITTSSTN